MLAQLVNDIMAWVWECDPSAMTVQAREVLIARIPEGRKAAVITHLKQSNWETRENAILFVTALDPGARLTRLDDAHEILYRVDFTDGSFAYMGTGFIEDFGRNAA